MKNELEIILQKYDNPHYLDNSKEKGIRYNFNRTRHCSLGYHTNCFYPGECGCVCHRLEDLIDRQKREYAVKILKKLKFKNKHACSNCGLTDEEMSEVNSYNLAVRDMNNLIDAKIKELTDGNN